MDNGTTVTMYEVHQNKHLLLSKIFWYAFPSVPTEHATHSEDSMLHACGTAMPHSAWRDGHSQV